MALGEDREEMIVSHAEVRSRIDQLKLSYDGYKRQLDHLELSPERLERLETDVRLLEQELATLETLAQFGRIEPDREKIEASVRERLAHVRERLAADPDLQDYSPEERDRSSGEIRALMWALGEDTLSLYTKELMKSHDADPSRTDRAVAALLVHTLEQGPDVDTRAGAAYDLGKLHVVNGIPTLAAALTDDPLVADVALKSLASFSDEELSAAGVTDQLLSAIQAQRR
jgi:hypothetical protein